MSESSLWNLEDEPSDENEYSEDEEYEPEPYQHGDEADGEPEMMASENDMDQSSHSGQDLRSGSDRSPPTVNIAEIERSVKKFWESVDASMENVDTEDFRTCALPLARIKKIVKLDENVNMLSAEVPILLSKAADLFIQDLTMRAWANTTSGKRRTIQQSDICAAAGQNEQFDFLIDILPRDEIVAFPRSTSAEMDSKMRIKPSSKCGYSEGSLENAASSSDTNDTDEDEEGEDEEEDIEGDNYEREQYANSDISALSSLTSDESTHGEAKEEINDWIPNNGGETNYCQSQGIFFDGPMPIGNRHLASGTSQPHMYNGQPPMFSLQTNNPNANIYYNNMALPDSHNVPAFYIMNTTPDGRILLSNPNTVGDPANTPLLQLTQEQLEQIASLTASNGSLIAQTVQQNIPYAMPATFQQNGLENGVTR